MENNEETHPSPDRIVYMKPVLVADLPAEMREQAGDADTVYSVHSEDGEQIAFVASAQLGKVLGRQNHMDVHYVH